MPRLAQQRCEPEQAQACDGRDHRPGIGAETGIQQQQDRHQDQRAHEACGTMIADRWRPPARAPRAREAGQAASSNASAGSRNTKLSSGNYQGSTAAASAPSTSACTIHRLQGPARPRDSRSAHGGREQRERDAGRMHAERECGPGISRRGRHGAGRARKRQQHGAPRPSRRARPRARPQTRAAIPAPRRRCAACTTHSDASSAAASAIPIGTDHDAGQ